MTTKYRRILVFTMLFLLVAAPLSAQFEGTFTTATTGVRDKSTPFTMKQEVSVKGNKFRTTMQTTDAATGPMTMIYREDKGTVCTLFEAQKMYLEMSTKKLKELMQSAKTPSSGKVTSQRTGKTKQILGHSCEQIILHDGEATVDAWVTRDLPGLRLTMQKLNEFQKEKVPKWTKELEKKKLFPMQTTITVQGVTAETTITSIDEKSLPDSFFDIPAGYTKQELPAGMSGAGK